MTKLQKVVIEVGGKKLEFTPEEAKELKAILSDLFGGERVVERIRERDYWHWWQPYIRYDTQPIFTTSTWSNTDGQPRSLSGSAWSVGASPESGTVFLSSNVSK